MRRKVLMASAAYWTSPYQLGGQHLARAFARAGWDVAFVSEPISPLYLLRGIDDELRERFAIYRAGGVRDVDGRVWAYVPGALLTPHNRPVLRSEWLMRHWPRLSWPRVRDAVARNGFAEIDLLYIDMPSQSHWLEAVAYGRSVFRVADNLTAFGWSTAATRATERYIARSVDVVVHSAESLRAYVESLSPRRTWFLPNGVDFGRFAAGPRTLPEEYRSIPPPRIVYVGAIGPWFDYGLLEHAAEALPEASFVLIGPDAFARTRLAPRRNIHLLGGRRHDELPRYLHNADVGIIPFDAAGHPDLVHGINPLKLYEYMACGLPVVATAWDELRRLRSPAILCETRAEFVAGLFDALRARPGAEVYTRFAAGADWSERVRSLIEAVGLGDTGGSRSPDSRACP